MRLDPQTDPQSILRLFGMVAHPEGGWYVETYRDPAPAGTRSAVSAIYFLLLEGERSHWHTVDACEIWLWHAGAPLKLWLSSDSQMEEVIALGSDLEAGERPQVVVPAGVWQAAESTGGWTLVSCLVAPGFEFGGFRMAAPGWSPGVRP